MNSRKNAAAQWIKKVIVTMNQDVLKKAFAKGWPIAALVWLGYGVVSSFFDDNVIEQMFEPTGIIVGLAAMATVVGVIYHDLVNKEKQDSEQRGA